MQANPGTVYLVGAGPGDPDLITVRGQSLLQQADVVVYDRLVHPGLLDLASPHAERLYVGKAPGQHVCAQSQIQEHLIEAARQDKVVVRLKGGDPFVFGRGGEEGQALREAGIPFVVVPGITSAVSVPAYAGIPVTHRGVANAFTVVTGHTCTEGDCPDWAALSHAGTLVILMGLRRLPQIAECLIREGRAPDTPAAVIAHGTTSEQVVVEGTLDTIADRAVGLRSPATIVVGDVVALRSSLAWFDPASEASEASPAPDLLTPVLRQPQPPHHDLSTRPSPVFADLHHAAYNHLDA